MSLINPLKWKRRNFLFTSAVGSGGGRKGGWGQVCGIKLGLQAKVGGRCIKTFPVLIASMDKPIVLAVYIILHNNIDRTSNFWSPISSLVCNFCLSLVLVTLVILCSLSGPYSNLILIVLPQLFRNFPPNLFKCAYYFVTHDRSLL